MVDNKWMMGLLCSKAQKGRKVGHLEMIGESSSWTSWKNWSASLWRDGKWPIYFDDLPIYLTAAFKC